MCPVLWPCEALMRNTPLICDAACNCRVLLCQHTALRAGSRTEAVQNTNLISLSHVAVEDSSHTLDGRMLQLMGASHVVVNASGQQRENSV